LAKPDFYGPLVIFDSSYSKKL